MLFNSYTFLFYFLPVVLAGFFFLKPTYRIGFLVAASLVFYAQWNVEHLFLLLGSVGLNYMVAKQLKRMQRKKLLLGTGIVLNLLPLAYFKYSFFLHLTTQSLALPLAISFYTFQQIAFLVDVYRKEIEPGSFLKYLFFVLFFPQLIAGPIVHYREIIGQVQKGALNQVSWPMIQVGMTLFSLGLFKKVVIADQLFPLANTAFGQIGTLGSADAWLGLLAYSLGIYFDFSAYTDMAIGLALFFGIKLPINFNSPYRAVNIVDFWRRWHITLSNFLRDYIYIPLGGNRKGELREISNLLITMILGGIWHGAGWTFLLWGLMHGILLSAVHLKKRYFDRWHISYIPAVLITFLCVTLLWVLFRAENLDEALQYYRILFDFGTGHLVSADLYTVLAALGVAWFMPNSIVFTGYRHIRSLNWQYAIIAGLSAFMALKMMAEVPAQSFVYFNF